MNMRNRFFIDSETDTWNMDPVALKKAFELYPDTKAVIVANLYGTPAKLDEIRKICDENGAILIEDAAESLGATYKERQTGTFGKYKARKKMVNTIKRTGSMVSARGFGVQLQNVKHRCRYRQRSAFTP